MRKIGVWSEVQKDLETIVKEREGKEKLLKEYCMERWGQSHEWWHHKLFHSNDDNMVMLEMPDGKTFKEKKGWFGCDGNREMNIAIDSAISEYKIIDWSDSKKKIECKMEKEVTRNGVTIVFYKEESDAKFSFRIKDSDMLTYELLNRVKTHRVREDKIKYAAKGIFEVIDKIKGGDTANNNNKIVNSMSNPIVELAEFCQQKFRANITTSVDGKSGADHCPKIFISITLPCGERFEASGTNQKEAKQKAAREALAWLNM